MRRDAAIAVIALAAALLLAGCGGGEEARRGARRCRTGNFGPAEPGSGARKRPGGAAAASGRRRRSRARWPPAMVGVVGVEGDVGVRPRVARGVRRRDARGPALERPGPTDAADGHRPRCACATATRPARPAGMDELRGHGPSSPRPRLCGRATYFDRADVDSSTASEPHDLRAGAVLTAGRRRARSGARARRGGRPRWPHSGHGERAISSRHQRHVHGPAACEQLGAEPRRRRPGRRRSPPACRSPTTSGRSASARPGGPRGRRARR